MTKQIKDMAIKEQEQYKEKVLKDIFGMNADSFLEHYIKEEVIKSYDGKQTAESSDYIHMKTVKKYNIVRKKQLEFIHALWEEMGF
jgi:hypothetical protein